MANLFLNSWATTIFGRCVISVLLLALALNISTASHPTHRYLFDATANDSIGTAHGTVIGNASITNGNLLLNGTNGYVRRRHKLDHQRVPPIDRQAVDGGWF
jgi:hypothetical protein